MFLHIDVDVDIIFSRISIFGPFWGPWGSIGGQKGQKLLITVGMTQGVWIFGHVIICFVIRDKVNLNITYEESNPGLHNEDRTFYPSDYTHHIVVENSNT